MNRRWRSLLYWLSLLALAGCGGGPVPGEPPPFEASLPKSGVNDVWYSQASRDTAIVFVHGILSDSRSCWWYQDPLDRSRNNFWPEIVKHDTRLGSPSIFLAGYYADVDSGIATIRDSAQQVWRGLTRTTNGQAPIEAKRILFITHSTGGIVARYLLDAYADQLREKVVGLMLVASPSGGSDAANALAEIIEMYESELGRTLMTNSAVLSDLDRRFKDLVANGTLPFLVGIEAIEHQRIFHRKYLPNFKVFEVTRLVPRESGGRYFGDARLLTRTDHFSTVKPNDERHPAHDLLLEFYSGRFAQASERARQVLERPIVDATNVVEITAANAGEYQDIGKLTAHRLVVRDVDVRVRDTSEIEANEIELVGSARITGQEITVRAGRLKGGRIVADGSDGPPGQPGITGGRIYVAAALSITGTTLVARGGKGGNGANGTVAGAAGGKGGTIHISSVNALDIPPDVNGGAGGLQAGKPGDPGSVFFTKFGNPLQARALAMTEGRAGLQGALIAAAVPATGTSVTPLPFVTDFAAASLPDIDRLATILRNDSRTTVVLQPGSDLPMATAQKQYRMTIELLQKRGVQRHQITTVEPNVAVVPSPPGARAGIEAILVPFKG
jgi:pimeloyl-ACP methyl ester carboxylesterase